jgi:hypothetical protein
MERQEAAENCVLGSYVIYTHSSPNVINYDNDKTEENEMDRRGNAEVQMRHANVILIRKFEGKRPLEKVGVA